MTLAHAYYEADNEQKCHKTVMSNFSEQISQIVHDDVLNPLLVLIPRQSLDRRAPPRRADLPEVNVVAVGAAVCVGACNGQTRGFTTLA